jgi:hypothetical protein
VARGPQLATIVALSMCVIGARAVVADVLIQRGGTERQGVLQSCSAAACVLDQKPVPRETIEWIGLAGQPPPPVVKNPTVDEAHARGGGVTQGKLIGIDASTVAMDSKTIPRSEIAWVHLGRAAASRTDWRGTFIWWIRQQVPAGPQNWDGNADLVLSDDGKGGLAGTLKGQQLQELKLSYCHAKTHGSLSADLAGTVAGDKMALKILNPWSDWPEETACVEGTSAKTGGIVFRWTYLAEAFGGLIADGHGNYVFERSWDIPQRYPTTLHYALKLTPAR